MKSILPNSEAKRLDTLHSYWVLDTLPEASYDDITYLASQICDAPISLISLVDEDRQWFKSRVGLAATETPRELAFCAHAILDPTDVMEVHDAQADARFAKNPLVTSSPDIRFYAGAPLVTSEGIGLGTLCVIDRVPRTLTRDQRRSLEALSRQVMAQLELRRAVAEAQAFAEERLRYQEKLESSQRDLERANAALKKENVTDALTGLMSRRAFERALEAEMERAYRYGSPLSLALLDLDFFKSFNDDFGHLDGDEALKQVARVLENSTRMNDLVGRIGGEEFGVILPNTSGPNAKLLAERFRHAVEDAIWERRALTVSIGVCAYHPSLTTRSDFMRLTDSALYRAKHEGRNRVARVEAEWEQSSAPLAQLKARA